MMSFWVLVIGGDGQPRLRCGRKIGPQAPPLTTTISKILQRYPEGGQILKVYIMYVSQYSDISCTLVDRTELDCQAGTPRG